LRAGFNSCLAGHGGIDIDPTKDDPHMKQIAAIILGACLLTGCAHRYDMMLTDSARITNVSKPILDRDNGVYLYKDVAGNQRYISSGRVIEIKPHSRHDDNQFKNR
jgi:hypothetical protein